MNFELRGSGIRGLRLAGLRIGERGFEGKTGLDVGAYESNCF